MAPRGAAAQGFQWPDEPESLEVLPEDIGADGLRDAMRGFAAALDVRCEHCHVGEGDLADFDFAADDKETKQVARVMMRILHAINAEHLADLGELGQRLGQVQARAGRREAAIESTERALELAPERARAFVRRQLERMRAGG